MLKRSIGSLRLLVSVAFKVITDIGRRIDGGTDIRRDRHTNRLSRKKGEVVPR